MSARCIPARHFGLFYDANPRSEYEVALVEEHELTAGPLSLLQTATRTHTQVLISCRNNRKVRPRFPSATRDAWQEQS